MDRLKHCCQLSTPCNELPSGYEATLPDFYSYMLLQRLSFHLLHSQKKVAIVFDQVEHSRKAGIRSKVSEDLGFMAQIVTGITSFEVEQGITSCLLEHTKTRSCHVYGEKDRATW